MLKGCGGNGRRVDKVALQGDYCGGDNGLWKAEEDASCLSKERGSVDCSMMGWVKGLEL